MPDRRQQRPASRSGGRGRRRRIRRLLLWLTASVAVLAAVVAVWLETAAPRLLEPRIERWVGARINSTVSIGELDLGWLPPMLEARDVEIVPAGETEPLATAVLVRVEARWRELLAPPRRLRSVRIEQPLLAVEVEEDGENNLPSIDAGGGGAGVEIDALEVVAGVATLDERRVPLELALRDLRVSASGNSRTGLVGSVDASDVVVDLPTGATYAGALAARLRWADRQLTLLAGRVSGPELRAVLTGGSFDSRSREFEVTLTAEGRAEWLARIGIDPGELTGPWRFDGAVGGSVADWSVEGELASERLGWDRFIVTALEAQMRLDRSSFRLADLGGRLAGGRLTGEVTVDLDQRSGSTRYTIREGNAGALVDLFGLEASQIGGTWDLDGDYSFALADPLAGSGRGTALIRLASEARTLRWQREVEASIRAGQVEFRSTPRRAAGESLVVEGLYLLTEGTGRIGYRLDTGKLGRWLEMLLAPSPELARWLPSGGRTSLGGVLNVRPGAWETRLEIDQFGGELGVLEIGQLGGALTASPTGLRDLRLDLAKPRGALSVSGAIRLSEADGAVRPDLRVAVDGWPASELLEQIGLDLPLEGDVVGVMNLGGSFDAPTGTLELAIAAGAAAGVPFGELVAELTIDPAGVEFERLEAVVAGGALSGRGRVEIDGSSADVEVAVDGVELGAESLAGLVPDGMRGTVAGFGRWSGSLDEPELEVDLTSTDLAVGELAASPGLPATVALGLEAGDLTLTARFADLVRATGGGRVEGESSRVSLQVESDALGKLVAALTPVATGSVDGAFAGTVELTGDLLAGDIQPEIELERFELRRGDRKLSALEPVVASWREGGLDVVSLFLGDERTGSELFVFGRASLIEGEELDLAAQLSVDTSWFELLLPEWNLTGGTVNALASITGSFTQPLINGQGELTQPLIRIPGLPQPVRDARAVVLFYPGTIVIDESDFRFAGGTVQGAGSIELYEEDGLDYRLQAAGREMQLRYPEGWLIQGDAELTLTSEPDGRQLRGQIALRRALYSDDIPVGLMQLLQRAFSRRPVIVDEADELLTTTALNLSVNGQGALRVRNNVADLRGDIDLIVRGNLARPVIFGDVQVESGGTLVYAGNEYDVQRAELSFVNPYRLEPVVDLEATTRLQEYDVTLSVAGTFDRLDVSFSSNPPLPDLDVLTLLAGGDAVTGPSDLRGRDEGSVGAQAFLYGQAASAVASRVNRLFGLDKFRIDPLTGESGNLSSARVTVGKRLSSDLFATYSYDPSQNEQQILQIEWQVSRLLTVVATQNGDGTYAVDLRWDRRF